MKIANCQLPIADLAAAPETKSLRFLALWIMLAVSSFYCAYGSAKASFLILVYLFALLQLAQSGSWRKAFYSGFAAGFLIGASRLEFFWTIFSEGAIALWIVLGFWIGLFTALARLALKSFSRRWGWVMVPFLWTGLEFFRSELYYLRFAWLSPGYAFATFQWLYPLKYIGVYGTGFLLAALAALAMHLRRNSRKRSLAFLSLASLVLASWALAGPGSGGSPGSGKGVRVGGVQLEFPMDRDVVKALDKLLKEFPQTDVAVLSEYTFHGPVPKEVSDWCRKNHRHLIVGGTDDAPKGNFYDTAFVIGPTGEIVFRQVKSVPIQFFKDGLPAPEQKLWNSPWGRLGLCVCYDLSYSRVTDRLVKMGAQAIIVPTMDVFDWGVRQHELHARIAPVRAAEYGIPIFRVASSGSSQLVDASGRVVAKASCPGEGEIISGRLELGRSGTLPQDRWLAPAAVIITSGFILWSILTAIRNTKNQSNAQASAAGRSRGILGSTFLT